MERMIFLELLYHHSLLPDLLVLSFMLLLGSNVREPAILNAWP
jgi:hypothetical protein